MDLRHTSDPDRSQLSVNVADGNLVLARVGRGVGLLRIHGHVRPQSMLIHCRSKLTVAAGDGARTRNFNLGKVPVRF